MGGWVGGWVVGYLDDVDGLFIYVGGAFVVALYTVYHILLPNTIMVQVLTVCSLWFARI